MNRLMLALITLMALLGLGVFTGEHCLALGYELTVGKLKNAEYQVRYGKVKLKDGFFENSDQNAHFHSVEWPDKVAFGDLNGDGVADAAAILWSFVGASGTLVDLVAIVNQNGHPKQAARIELGNKVNVESLSIRSGQIVMEIVRHTPDDPLCCPSHDVTEKYRLSGKNLVLAP